MDEDVRLMGLLQQALVSAARTRLSDTARALGATDISVVFTAPARGELQASAQATGGGRSVCFCEAELRDPTGKPVARAMGTFRYRSASGA